jgi:hypothetical protein
MISTSAPTDRCRVHHLHVVPDTTLPTTGIVMNIMKGSTMRTMMLSTEPAAAVEEMLKPPQLEVVV